MPKYCFSFSRQRSRYLSFAIWLSTIVSLTALGWNLSAGNRSISFAAKHNSLLTAQAAAQTEPDSDGADSDPANSDPVNSSEPELSAAGSEVVGPAHVLVIHSYNLDFDWTRREKTGIDQTFAEISEQLGRDVMVYHEFLDAKRYPSLDYSQDFLSYVQRKYKDTPLQMLMVSDDPGTNLILANRDKYFPTLPVVFMGVNKVRQEILDTPWLTGAFEVRTPIQTVLAATKQTGSDHIIITIDSSETGQANLSLLEDLSSTPGAPEQVILIEDLTPDAIAQEIGIYPDSWPIFLSGQLRQDTADGPLINPGKDVEILRSQISNPIYTDTFPRLGRGTVGGQVPDGEYHAQQAVQLARQLLEGTPISEIEPLIESENRWIFDAQELERIRFDKDQLPEGSVLINEEPSFYEQYRFLVWLTAISFSLGLLTIIVLSHAIRRQKHAENRLRENEKQLEQNVLARTAELSETLAELKQTQAQLIQTEKLSSLGQLVGGIAHEFNNPLSFIYSNLGHLQSYIDNLLALVGLYQAPTTEPQAIAAHIEDIELAYIQQDAPNLIESTKRGTQRIQTIVSTLQNFVRSDEQGIKPTDLNQSLESTLLMLNAQIGEKIEVVKDYGELPSVHCRPGDINQVFMSILSNAIAALENKSEHKSPKQITIQTSANTDDWVQVVIKDNGPGIPLEIQ
ncbi:MAG: ATP-binding protein, partial [Cyanobacteria bacterium J06650_10]